MTTPRPRRLPALFVVAAGPRLGFGHLVRCRSLARAMGVAPVVAVRGTAVTRRRATADGWRVVRVRSDEDVRALGPRLIVVDDPAGVSVGAWVARARRLHVPVATVHDLGIAATDADLVIDGSLAPDAAIRGRYGTLHGPAYAILDPALATVRRRLPAQASARSGRPRVLIALGGGLTSRLATRLAAAIAERLPNVDLRLVLGFAAGSRPPPLPWGRWIDARSGLARELATASVAVVAGGVTLYEACALAVPAVAVPLHPTQGITVRAAARRGVVVAAREPGEVARQVERLLQDAGARRRLARAARALVDGRGAARVADHLRRLSALGADK